jgi:hypothetical protein
MQATAEAERLTPEDVREFQTLVLEETGVQLSTQEAWNRAIELIALVRMLVKPYPEDEPDEGVQTSSRLPS